MLSPYTRAAFQAQVARTLASPAAMQAALGADDVTLPDALNQWLTRLRLLYGVPFNYLVPDEAMLPPESIRFFCLDADWVTTLVDGAFSIGRQPTAATGSANPSTNLDRAVLPGVHRQLLATAGRIRARLLGTPGPVADTSVITGFLLRSHLVADYPGVTVEAYGSADSSAAPLTILRLEQLGPQSNTLLCLVMGTIYQVLFREAPEQLHYGFDGTPATANKTLPQLPGAPQAPSGTTDFSTCFRPQAPRTVNFIGAAGIAGLAGTVAAANGLSSVNAAQLGYSLVEGAGEVQFLNTAAPAA